VEELLQHMAGVTFPVSPTVPSPREFGYRSKITPHFNGGSRKPQTGESRPPPIGFLKQGTRFEIVDVPACPIATPEINDKLTEVRARAQARIAAGEYERGVTLLLRHAQEGVVTDYDAIIHEIVDQPHSPASGLNHPPSLRLRFLARDFFQNNPFILPAFTAYVREQAAASGARFLVDAYCGSGLFALSAASAFTQVAGIFAGLTFSAADTAVIIDPPRKGCDASFLAQLFAYGPRTVVYVSCDPATQMRDLQGFLAAGYRLAAVQPFDLFPQTRHLECVITLHRAAVPSGARAAEGLPHVPNPS